MKQLSIKSIIFILILLGRLVSRVKCSDIETIVQLLSSAKFIVHLYNQRVVNEDIIVGLVKHLLKNLSDYNVGVIVDIVTECGFQLEARSPISLQVINYSLISFIHERKFSDKAEALILGLVQKQKEGIFQDIPPELDLFADPVVHVFSFSCEIDEEDSRDSYKYDPLYEEMERSYAEVRESVLAEKPASLKQKLDKIRERNDNIIKIEKARNRW